MNINEQILSYIKLSVLKFVYMIIEKNKILQYYLKNEHWCDNVSNIDCMGRAFGGFRTEIMYIMNLKVLMN